MFLVFPAILFVHGSERSVFLITEPILSTIGKTRHNGMHNEPDPTHINLTLDLDPSNSHPTWNAQNTPLFREFENASVAICSKLWEKGDKNINSLTILFVHSLKGISALSFRHLPQLPALLCWVTRADPFCRRYSACRMNAVLLLQLWKLRAWGCTDIWCAVLCWLPTGHCGVHKTTSLLWIVKSSYGK